MTTRDHSVQSATREKLIEHLFIGEILKHAWKNGVAIEIAKPEVDNAGYDIILESNRIIRHVQLKSSYIGGRTSQQKIHISLADKPSGCVIWVYFNEESLDLGPFYFYGNLPGEPLPSIESLKIAKHTKGNKDGIKAERPNLRVINIGNFKRLETISDLYQHLF